MTKNFQRLKEITNSKDDDHVNCDLSSISIDHFSNLSNLLLEYGIKKIGFLNFNCNTAVTFTKDMLKAKKRGIRLMPPSKLEGSIYSQNQDMESDVAALLSRILPKSKSLRSLAFHSICFSHCDFDVLSQALHINKSLRTLKFDGIPFRTSDFIHLARALQHRFLLNLTLRNCHLKNRIAEPLIKLIRSHNLIQRKAEQKADIEKKSIGVICLSNIDLRDNKFTSDFVLGIVDEIEASYIYRLDLRDNARIPGSLQLSKKIIVGTTPIIHKSASKLSKRGELEVENRKLRSKLDMLQTRNISTIDKRTFVIGERAKEFVDHVNELDSLAKYLTDKKSEK